MQQQMNGPDFSVRLKTKSLCFCSARRHSYTFQVQKLQIEPWIHHKMCSTSPPWALTKAVRRRHWRHWLNYNCNNNQMLQLNLHSNNSLWVLQDVIIRLKYGYYRGFVANATAVVSWVDPKISPSNFIKKLTSSNQIMLKILWLFFVDTMQFLRTKQYGSITTETPTRASNGYYGTPIGTRMRSV